MEDPDSLVNDTRFKCVALDTPAKSIEILPSKKVSNNKEIVSYILANISSKFPRTGYTSGDYDGGASHNQVVTIAFSDPAAGVVTVTATGPTFGAQVLGTFTTVGGGSNFTPVSILVNPDDTISIVAGTNYASQVLASEDDAIPIGGSNQFKVTTIVHEVDAGNATTQTIENSDILDRRAFGGGGGGAAGVGGLGSDLADLLYRSSFEDDFADSDLVDLAVGKTNGSFNITNEYYSMNYDADKTATTVGTSLVVSSAPAYTVSVGDMILVTVGANQEPRKITVLGSINSDGGEVTPATLESAFSTDQGTAEQSSVICEADSGGSLNNKYFFIYTPYQKYHVWYNVNSAGVDPDPDPGVSIGIEVAIATNATPIVVGSATETEINSESDFLASGGLGIVNITNTQKGAATDITDGNTGWAFFSTNIQGTAVACCISQSVDTVDMINWYDSDDEESLRISEMLGHIALTNISNGASDSVDHSESPDWLTATVNDIVIKNVSGTDYETTISSITDADTFVLADTTSFGSDGNARIISPISQFCLNYSDDGLIDDINISAQIITATDLAANWANEYSLSRKQNFQDELAEQSIAGTAGAHLYARFFANKTSGNGTVKLYGYQSFFSKESDQAQGGVHNQAYGRTDGTGTERNCTVTIPSSNTRITVTGDFPSFIPAVNPGEAHGELIVTLNGQRIPRFIDSTITNGVYYTEDSNGTYIELDQDYSGFAYEFSVERRLGTIDTSDVNTTKLAKKVYIGIDYADWAAAKAANSAGTHFVFISGTYSPSANYDVDYACTIEMARGVTFDGSGAGIKGFNVTGDDVIFELNGCLFQDWDTAGDYAIYFDVGADRGQVYNGRFTNNDSDILLQPDTIEDGNFSY